MEPVISDILKIVREEVSLYRDLIEHVRRKSALLVQGRVDAIMESNKVEENFSLKLRSLEAEIRRLCSELCHKLQIPREEFTLLKLAERADRTVAVEIESQTTLFKNLVDQLKAVNRRNTRLIESSVRYSRGMLDMISNATSSYQGTGLFRPFAATQTSFSRRV